MSFKSSFLLHIAVVVAYAIGAILFALTTALVWPVVAWWWPAVEMSSVFLEGLVRGALIFGTYILWGLTLLAVIAVVRNVFRLSVPAGAHTMRAWATARFYIYNVLVLMARYFFLPMTRSTTLHNVFYRAMGAKIGKRTVLNTTHIYDLNLLTFGDDVTVGGSAVIMCHIGQGNDMYIAPVTLEDGSSVGEAAIVMPGATIGQGAVVGAGSVVPRDFKVPPHTKWSGVPIQQVGEDQGPIG